MFETFITVDPTTQIYILCCHDLMTEFIAIIFPCGSNDDMVVLSDVITSNSNSIEVEVFTLSL